METTYDRRKPLMEHNLGLETTFMEDSIQWKGTFEGSKTSLGVTFDGSHLFIEDYL